MSDAQQPLWVFVSLKPCGHAVNVYVDVPQSTGLPWDTTVMQDLREGLTVKRVTLEEYKAKYSKTILCSCPGGTVAAIQDVSHPVLRALKQIVEANILTGSQEMAARDLIMKTERRQRDRYDFQEAREKVCEEIQAIMRTYREQERTRLGIDTPGGLEHMGDVWSLLMKWDRMLEGGA